MSWRWNNVSETELHKAVLNDDYTTIESFKNDPIAIEAKNSLGFTSVELAMLLGKKKCLEIMASCPQHKIKIVLRNEEVVKTLSEEDFHNILQVDYISGIQFSSYELLKEVIKDIPWLLKGGFFGRLDRRLGELYKDKIWTGYTINSIIKWIDPVMGYGLFADQDLIAGEYAGEYAGKIRWLSRNKPDTNDYCFLYPTRFLSLNYYVIDPRNAGNEMRFINHSDNPNLKPAWAVDRGLLHMVFIAKENISKGDQLTYDYGKDYWLKRQKKTE